MDKGYPMSKYNLMTQFPKRNLADGQTVNHESTLESLGLYPSEALFLQEKH